VESKRGRIRRVKHWQFAFFVILSTSIALAEDFKTVTGKEYKDATITRIEGDGIVLRTKTGISKVYFVELPKDLQEKFRPVQATPIPARAPINGESKQGERPAEGRIVGLPTCRVEAGHLQRAVNPLEPAPYL